MAKGSVYEFLVLGVVPVRRRQRQTWRRSPTPLIATLFPHNRTHYLNILHASWPAGPRTLGRRPLGWVLGEQYKWPWHYQLALYLVPVLLYGALFLGQPMPKSEASKRGLSMGEMFKDVGILGGLVVCFLLALFFASVCYSAHPQADGVAQRSGRHELHGPRNSAATPATPSAAILLIVVGRHHPAFSFGAILLFVLFVVHALVGAVVELGTDNWIQNITGNILTTGQGRILFVFTSMLMFLLRFCADFHREEDRPVARQYPARLRPCWPAPGLLLTSQVTTFVLAMLALTGLRRGQDVSSGRPCWPWRPTASRAPGRWRSASWAASA